MGYKFSGGRNRVAACLINTYEIFRENKGKDLPASFTHADGWTWSLKNVLFYFTCKFNPSSFTLSLTSFLLEHFSFCFLYLVCGVMQTSFSPLMPLSILENSVHPS